MRNSSSRRPGVATTLRAAARLAWAAVTIVAIAATFAETASRGPVNPFNFFGYFTIQSNSLLAATALIAGVAGLRRPGPQAGWVVVLRSLATVCMVIVGLVYAVLLAPLGLEGGAPVPWANWVMHVGGPVLAACDWAFARDREPLPWRAALLQLIYPLVWTAVVLVRGATDGWVPYPFLSPEQGYGVVMAYAAVIALVFLAVSFGVVWWSRRFDGGARIASPARTQSLGGRAPHRST